MYKHELLLHWNHNTMSKGIVEGDGEVLGTRNEIIAFLNQRLSEMKENLIVDDEEEEEDEDLLESIQEIEDIIETIEAYDVESLNGEMIHLELSDWAGIKAERITKRDIYESKLIGLRILLSYGIINFSETIQTDVSICKTALSNYDLKDYAFNDHMIIDLKNELILIGSDEVLGKEEFITEIKKHLMDGNENNPFYNMELIDKTAIECYDLIQKEMGDETLYSFVRKFVKGLNKTAE